MTQLNYNHLRYFWAVAREGNLTRTAAALNVSQSSLSVQIAKLEQRLGHRLFDRVGRHLALTEAGQIALEHADAIFASGEDLIATLRDSGKAREQVRIGALATLSRNFQLDFMRPLLGRPQYDIIVRSGGPDELLGALSALSLDVVLTNQPVHGGADPRLIVQLIASQDVGLVAPPGLVSGDRSLPRLLRDYPFVLPTPGTTARSGFDSLAGRLGITPQIVAEVDDMAMMRLVAREGAAIALLPPIVVKDELASGTLVEIAKLAGVTEDFYAITIHRRFPSRAVTQLLRPDGDVPSSAESDQQVADNSQD